MPPHETSETTEGAPGAPMAGAPGASDRPPDAPARSAPSPYDPGYTPLWNNAITMSGIFIAIVGILGLVTFGLFHVAGAVTNPYVDIVGYMILPGILVLGLIVIPLGILWKSWRLHRHDPSQRLAFRFPRIDLNDPLQRRAAKIVVGGTFLLLPVVGVTSYHGYHFTDSTQFCANVCHSVMEPQGTAYEHSAHARVPCAECHIGEGASWFVKSKLSGARQVIATWKDSYPRPIPPAISELRPARDTCEQCHWPKKFFGAQLRQIVHFAFDENNTRGAIDMLVKTGGGDQSTMRAEGIHMHMALANQFDYVALDDKLQEIPWVKMTDLATGEESIYRSDGRPSSDPIPQGQMRRLDCMDCHNRPAHHFESPAEAVDVFLEAGWIDTTLPYIKREAVAALARPYPDTETANARVGASLSEFYRTHYPEIWRARRASVNDAIDKVREIYSRSFFPIMKVDWKTYPDNIGHKISAGCFRCHDGKHVNQRGEVLTTECSLCHTFLNPAPGEGGATMYEQGEFTHPVDLVGVHQQVLCHKCHDGGVARPTTCDGCHAETTALRTGELALAKQIDSRLAIEPDPMADLDCDACHNVSAPISVEAIQATCVDCHDEDYAAILTQWKTDVEQARAKAEAALAELAPAALHGESPVSEDVRRRLMAELKAADPLHNPTAAVKLYNAIAQRAAITTTASAEAG